jgi:hypothetical protein
MRHPRLQLTSKELFLTRPKLSKPSPEIRQKPYCGIYPLSIPELLEAWTYGAHRQTGRSIWVGGPYRWRAALQQQTWHLRKASSQESPMADGGQADGAYHVYQQPRSTIVVMDGM